MSIIEIDGSEGGGSMLRQALALSLFTQKPFIIRNIRAKRPTPGLSAQHLVSLHVAQSLSQAQVRGNHLGAITVSFAPGPITKSKASVDIGTAGSLTLLLQSVLLPFVFSQKQLRLELVGGTDVSWSPPIDYCSHVFFPQLKKFADISVKVLKRGYFPKGAGLVQVVIKTKGSRPKIHLSDRGEVFKVWGVSHASVDLEPSRVATRQADAARIILSQLKVPIDIQSSYSPSACSGSGITLWALCGDKEGSNLLNPVILGADALGERQIRSEEVGSIAANALKEIIQSNVPCDPFLADQLIPYLGVVGGSIRTSNITKHIMHNILVTEKFLSTKFIIEENTITAIPQALPVED